MTRRIVGPFNRVEGDLEVHLDIAAGAVREARVVSPMYRGFEQILHGKAPADALVITPRICGICSVAQSMAAARALADASGLTMPPNGALAANLILAAENVADHLTHFYMFFMPDFCRAVYAGEPWHADAVRRFKAVEGEALREMLPARATFMHMLGLLAGKWPHTLGIQPGGTTRAVDAAEQTRLTAMLAGFRRFLERTLFGGSLERIAALASVGELEAWGEEAPAFSSDFRAFLAIARAVGLASLGAGPGRFMSYGAYDGLFAQGVYADGEVAALDPGQIAEDMSHSLMAHRNGQRHPFDGITTPDADAEGGYTWCKAPRLGGEVVEVGALARQLADGQPLLRDIAGTGGGSVLARVVARMVEIARTVIAMEGWVKAIACREPFHVQGALPDDARGAGLIEAARGSLGHWLRVRNGRILNYQIIAPTTWNFSPRDRDGQPGALEQALISAPVREGEADPVAVQHTVRSFDPCMVCTVH